MGAFGGAMALLESKDVKKSLKHKHAKRLKQSKQFFQDFLAFKRPSTKPSSNQLEQSSLLERQLTL
jgi:hypothetical protein